jgi:hypothetical protein
MRSTCLSTIAVTFLMLLVQQSQAALIWQTQPAAGASVKLKLSNYEEIVSVFDGSARASPQNQGDELRGIFTIQSIVDANTAALYWSSGFAGQELTGYFMSYLVDSMTVNGPNTSVDFLGGLAQIFIGTTGPAFNPLYTANDGGPVPHGAGYSDGELWLDLVGVNGVSGPSTTLNITYTSMTTPTGIGDGYFSIIGGSGASEFKPDALDPTGTTLGQQDLQFESRISSTVAGWPASSEDPITGVIVPEPSSVFVWSLLAFGAVCGRAYRRRRAR